LIVWISFFTENIVGYIRATSNQKPTDLVIKTGYYSREHQERRGQEKNRHE
jgi:hypothetical protein